MIGSDCPTSRTGQDKRIDSNMMKCYISMNKTIDLARGKETPSPILAPTMHASRLEHTDFLRTIHVGRQRVPRIPFLAKRLPSRRVPYRWKV